MGRSGGGRKWYSWVGRRRLCPASDNTAEDSVDSFERQYGLGAQSNNQHRSSGASLSEGVLSRDKKGSAHVQYSEATYQCLL